MQHKIKSSGWLYLFLSSRVFWEVNEVTSHTNMASTDVKSFNCPYLSPTVRSQCVTISSRTTVWHTHMTFYSFSCIINSLLPNGALVVVLLLLCVTHVFFLVLFIYHKNGTVYIYWSFSSYTPSNSIIRLDSQHLCYVTKSVRGSCLILRDLSLTWSLPSSYGCLSISCIYVCFSLSVCHCLLVS